MALLGGHLLEWLLMGSGGLASACEAHVGNASRHGIDAAGSRGACVCAGVGIVGISVATGGRSSTGRTDARLLGMAILDILSIRSCLGTVTTVRRSAGGLGRCAVLTGSRGLAASTGGTDVEGIGGVRSLLLLSSLSSVRTGGRRGLALGLLLLLVLEALLVAIRRWLTAILLAVRGRHGRGRFGGMGRFEASMRRQWQWGMRIN